MINVHAEIGEANNFGDNSLTMMCLSGVLTLVWGFFYLLALGVRARNVLACNCSTFLQTLVFV